MPSADLARLSLADFTDAEVDVPYYLAHFHRLANSMVAEGENRGFLSLPVWRGNVEPFNARVMENCLALAHFYSTRRPWNPYYGHSAVRARLETALDFWCRSQSPDGRFAEYGPREWNLPATAFATKFMGETLRLLASGPAIDPALHQRVIEADRKAILAVLTMEALYEHGRSYTNQYSNVWGGALAYMALFPDKEIDRLLRQRLHQSMTDFQSPAGYFYEANGPDWSYNLGTHHSDLQIAWHYARGTELEDEFVEQTRLFYDWLAYNAVREPDGSGYTVNRAIECRKHVSFLPDPNRVVLDPREMDRAGRGETALAEKVSLARAFVPTQEAVRRRIAAMRDQWLKTWPDTLPIEPGFFSYSPYAFLHRNHRKWYPGDEEQRAAIAALPYLARQRFVHRRVDSRNPTVYTYIRRPGYYAAFNSGKLIRSQQRYGLGLVWSPSAGSVLQSQTGSGDAAWGTLAEGEREVYEARSFQAEFNINGRAIRPVAGCRDLLDGSLQIAYPLGDKGRKTLAFSDQGITITIHHPGTFTELVPLLVDPTDDLRQGPTELTLTRGTTSLAIGWDGAGKSRLGTTRYQTGSRSVRVIRLDAADALTYRLDFTTQR